MFFLIMMNINCFIETEMVSQYPTDNSAQWRETSTKISSQKRKLMLHICEIDYGIVHSPNIDNDVKYDFEYWNIVS